MSFNQGFFCWGMHPVQCNLVLRIRACVAAEPVLKRETRLGFHNKNFGA